MADSRKVGDSEREIFEKAAEHLTTLAGSLDEDKLLYLYGRYKQVKDGPCDIPKPGFFSIQAKRKWSAWQSLGSMSAAQAMKEYVEEISDLDPNWNPTGDVKHNRAGLGVSVSTLKCDPDDFICDDEKNLFDWVKDGNPSRVAGFLENGGDANLLDSEGMALLHWASDRGHSEIVKLLIRGGANINMQDNEGQTALHYASSCGHTETVKALLEEGADVTISDGDNMTPSDVAMDASIASLICR